MRNILEKRQRFYYSVNNRERMPFMLYHILTYGCGANKADAERIARRLERSGHQKAPDKAGADIVVINACSVRQSAINRLYSKVKQFGDKKVILTGCILNSDKNKLKSMVDEIWDPDEYFDEIPVYSGKFSANVPIMTGCDNFCTYCAVPYTRGREHSRPAGEIITEIKKLIKGGYKEIWLLGQNVNKYSSGNGTSKINFSKLLRKVNDIPGNFWIRFTSPHPRDFSDELISTIEIGRASCRERV